MTESEPYANKRANRARNRSHPSRARALSAIGISFVVICSRFEANPMAWSLRHTPPCAPRVCRPLPVRACTRGACPDPRQGCGPRFAPESLRSSGSGLGHPETYSFTSSKQQNHRSHRPSWNTPKHEFLARVLTAHSFSRPRLHSEIYSKRQGERSDQCRKASVAQAVVLSAWQVVQGFGILYFSVIAGMIKAKVCDRTLTSAIVVSILGI